MSPVGWQHHRAWLLHGLDCLPAAVLQTILVQVRGVGQLMCVGRCVCPTAAGHGHEQQLDMPTSSGCSVWAPPVLLRSAPLPLQGHLPRGVQQGG